LNILTEYCAFVFYSGDTSGESDSSMDASESSIGSNDWCLLGSFGSIPWQGCGDYVFTATSQNDICTKLLEICMIIHASLSEKQLSMAATLPLPFGCTSTGDNYNY
jgi:hypothetical protein